MDIYNVCLYVCACFCVSFVHVFVCAFVCFECVCVCMGAWLGRKDEGGKVICTSIHSTQLQLGFQRSNFILL
jgi:hypothetical protein